MSFQIFGLENLAKNLLAPGRILDFLTAKTRKIKALVTVVFCKRLDCFLNPWRGRRQTRAYNPVINLNQNFLL